MILYMIRHGQSEGNARHAHAGWTDISLTELGFAQAAEAGRKLREIRFDRVICSDILRARQTCETALPGVKYELEPLVRENHVGWLAGQLVSDLTEMMGDAYTQNRFRRDYTEYGGESREIMTERVRRFAKKAEGFPEQETVAVFAHEGTLRCMMDIVMGVPLPLKNYACPNCMTAVFEYKDEKWRLLKWGV